MAFCAWVRAMNFEQLANFGEFIGGVAVVLSLLYVGLQIRQNTKVTRAAAYQAFYQSNGEAIDSITRGMPASELFFRGVREPRSLSEEERGQFRLLLYRLISAFESSFFLYRDGLMTQKHWNRQLGIAKFWCSLPGVKEELPTNALDKEFLAEVGIGKGRK